MYGYYSNGFGDYGSYGGYGSYGSYGLEGSLQGLLVFYGVLLFLLFAIAVANYLFKGFGLYGMAKKMNVKYPWLAFIPFASNYLQGELSGDVTVGKKTVKNIGLWTLLVPIAVGVITFIMLFVFLFTSIFSIAIQAERMNELIIGAGFYFSLLFVVLIAVVLSAAESLLFGVVRYQIHKKYTDDIWAVIHMIIGLFIPLYQSVYFFVLRNRYPKGMENPYDSQIAGPSGGVGPVYQASPVSPAGSSVQPQAPVQTVSQPNVEAQASPQPAADMAVESPAQQPEENAAPSAPQNAPENPSAPQE